MADSIVRLKVESSEYDQKLKRAAEGLTRYADECRKMGGTLEVVDKETLDYVRALGQMDTTSRTATGKLVEMKKTFVELSAQYKQMTDAEKQSEFGKALSEGLDQLKTRIIDTKEQLSDIQNSLNNGIGNKVGDGLFSGLGDKMSGALQVFAGNMLTKAAGAVANLGSEMYGMVQQGIELAKQGEGIRIAFERLGRGDILQGLREATHGTVTDLELMKAAVKFNDFKLPVEELGTMLAFAQQKAKDTGQSVDYMVDSIVTGLGRKSLMILDNLGLSAAEIKEKMAETGDMTKAVGAIIREQMSKAGDYVETASERATQAEVDLKNAMEQLGKVFAPLTEQANSFFSSIQIGAVKAMTKIGEMLNTLSAAGRAGNVTTGEDANIQKGLGKLRVAKAAGSSYMVNSLYNDQVESYNRRINDYDAQIKNGGKRPGAGSGESRDIRWLQAQRDGLVIARDQYIQQAKQIMNPIVNNTTVDTGGSGGGGKGGGSDDKKKFKISSIAFDANKAMLAAVKGEGEEEPSEVWKAITQGAQESTTEVERLTAAFEKLNEVQGVTTGEAVKDSSNMADKWQKAGTAISAVGSAMSSIEDPAAKVAATIAQAIATIALTYAQSLRGTFTPWDWIAAAIGGVATMVSVISTIHSATGYAQGGIVGGNQYSGDNIYAGNAMVNSGELVLNKAQQGNLASQLQGNGINGMNISGRIKGTDIILSVDRSLQLQGKQLLTWG